MTKFSTSNGEWLAVEVPDDSSGHRIAAYQGDKVILHSMNLNSGVGPNGLIAVPSKSTLLGRADILTDEQWAGIVDKCEGETYIYPNYEFKGLRNRNASYSGRTLFRSLSIPLNSLIIKID